MTSLAKLFEPSKYRLMDNAKRMMETANDPWFKCIVSLLSKNSDLNVLFIKNLLQLWCYKI